jgi:diguanylate cyclase (GGDEF)-like protein
MKIPLFHQAITAAFHGNRKNRLIILVVVVLGTAFFATAILSYGVSRARMHDLIVSSELPLTSDTVYSEIQRDFIKPIQASSLMASDTFLRDWALAGETDVTAIKKYLAEQKRVNAAFTTYFVSGKTYHYYTADGVRKTVSRDDTHDVWFFALENAKVDYVLELDTDQHHDNALTIFINYRVFDYNNNFIGIAGMGLNVDVVRDSVGRYQQQFGRKIFFVDQAGKVMMSGEDAQLLTDIRTVPGLSALADKILGGQGGALEYEKDGETHLLNVRYIPELKWYLFVERVEEQAMQDMRRTLYINLLIAVLATTLVAAVLAGAVNRFHAELDKYATTDSLTGLTNRRAFDILFHQAALGAKRNDRPLSLVLFDIDHFKKINDQFGHLAGDEVIKSVARIISERSRASDVACRWGGEEMLLLLQDCRLPKAIAIADDIRQDIERTLFDVRGHVIPVAVSAGVAEMALEDSEDSVLARADAGLYAAKNGGRNRVAVAGAESSAAAAA